MVIGVGPIRGSDATWRLMLSAFELDPEVQDLSPAQVGVSTAASAGCAPLDDA